jgi:hypothetical protein
MTMKLIVEAEFYSTMEKFKRGGWLGMEDVVSFRLLPIYPRLRLLLLISDDGSL